MKVFAVTAMLSAENVANGSMINVECRLNGSARWITQLEINSGMAEPLAHLDGAGGDGGSKGESKCEREDDTRDRFC